MAVMVVPAKMSKEAEKMREKYPFIVDFESERFDAATMENVRMEGALVSVKKGECAKCGGKRHSATLKPGEIAVNESFLLETRRLVPRGRLLDAVEKVWGSLGAPIQMKILQAAFEQMALELEPHSETGICP